MRRKVKYYSKEEVDDWDFSFKTENKKFIDLTGKKFGKFTVLKIQDRKSPHTYWFCECSCNNISVKTTNQLNRGDTQCNECNFIEGYESRIQDKLKDIKSWHPSLALKSRTGNHEDNWLWYCEECNTPFSTRLLYVHRKDLNCRCDGNFFCLWTLKLREYQIRAECSSRGLKFLGWADGEVYKNNERIFVKCPDHPHYSITVNNFLNGYGCPDCGIIKRSEASKHDSSLIKVKGEEIFQGKYNYEKFEYISSRTPSLVYCNDCKKSFNVSYDNHINKQRGCPYEKGRNQKQSYIFLVSDNGVPVAIKSGIANNYKDRLYRQNKKSVFEVTLIGVWGYETSVSCKMAEKVVNSSFERGIMSKRDYPDGFNETLSLENLDAVVNIYEEHGGVKIDVL